MSQLALRGLGGNIKMCWDEGLHPEKGVNTYPGLVNVSLQRWVEDGNAGSFRQSGRDVRCLRMCVSTRGSIREQSQHLIDRL